MLPENGIQAKTSSNKVLYRTPLVLCDINTHSIKLFQTSQLMLRFNNDASELSFQHTTTTQTLSMLAHNKWQKKRLERVRMKTEKAITGSVITCHYTVLAICITRWVIKGSNTVTLLLLWRLSLLRKAVSTVRKNKWPLPNISQNDY